MKAHLKRVIKDWVTTLIGVALSIMVTIKLWYILDTISFGQLIVFIFLYLFSALLIVSKDDWLKNIFNSILNRN